MNDSQKNTVEKQRLHYKKEVLLTLEKLVKKLHEQTGKEIPEIILHFFEQTIPKVQIEEFHYSHEEHFEARIFVMSELLNAPHLEMKENREKVNTSVYMTRMILEGILAEEIIAGGLEHGLHLSPENIRHHFTTSLIFDNVPQRTVREIIVNSDKYNPANAKGRKGKAIKKGAYQKMWSEIGKKPEFFKKQDKYHAKNWLQEHAFPLQKGAIVDWGKKTFAFHNIYSFEQALFILKSWYTENFYSGIITNPIHRKGIGLKSMKNKELQGFYAFYSAITHETASRSGSGEIIKLATAIFGKPSQEWRADMAQRLFQTLRIQTKKSIKNLRSHIMNHSQQSLGVFHDPQNWHILGISIPTSGKLCPEEVNTIFDTYVNTAAFKASQEASLENVEFNGINIVDWFQISTPDNIKTINDLNTNQEFIKLMAKYNKEQKTSFKTAEEFIMHIAPHVQFRIPQVQLLELNRILLSKIPIKQQTQFIEGALLHHNPQLKDELDLLTHPNQQKENSISFGIIGSLSNYLALKYQYNGPEIKDLYELVDFFTIQYSTKKEILRAEITLRRIFFPSAHILLETLQKNPQYFQSLDTKEIEEKLFLFLGSAKLKLARFLKHIKGNSNLTVSSKDLTQILQKYYPEYQYNESEEIIMLENLNPKIVTDIETQPLFIIQEKTNNRRITQFNTMVANSKYKDIVQFIQTQENQNIIKHLSSENTIKLATNAIFAVLKHAITGIYTPHKALMIHNTSTWVFHTLKHIAPQIYHYCKEIIEIFVKPALEKDKQISQELRHLYTVRTTNYSLLRESSPINRKSANAAGWKGKVKTRSEEVARLLDEIERAIIDSR